MSYVKTDGTYVYTEPFPAVASAARTTSSAATGVEVGNRSSLRSLTMAVTAQTGGSSPTLDVRVETGPDNSTWTTVGSFTQATGVTSQTKSFAGLDRYARVAWTIGGTGGPSFTFSVSGAELI